ncbi:MULTISPECIES: SCO family protein [Shouchella]|uniref:SCO family protein n=3 Tax=Shouchella TaxID=2893057 RepID=A0ABY7W523_9BACI|nr:MULTISPECIES: SCO family protein [Shouchella]MED4127614.1 SCO family protein [Shouchella miscanthi]WDF04052.1 SCO family protein [Shouchella hunanensis]
MKTIISIITLFLLSGCGWMYGMGQSSEFDLTEAAIHVPEFTFTNQDEQAFGSDDVAGEHWLANFAFTNCTTVCLTMMPNMNQLQQDLASEGYPLQFITFTADPILDTPEQLRQYAENIGVGSRSWDFLTGYDIDELETFSNEAFRVPYAYGDTPEDIIHSTSFFLVNKEGQVVRKYNGLEMNQADILEDIIRYVSENE